MSNPFEIDPDLTGDARVVREITTKLGRALTGGGRPVTVGEIEDDILKAIASSRSGALDEALALIADTDRWWTRDLFGPDDTAEAISAVIKTLKTP